MNQELASYIKSARQAGLNDDQIASDLQAAGWPKEIVPALLKAETDKPYPPAPPAGPLPAPAVKPAPSATGSQSIFGSFSVHGFEYIIMFLAMGASAFALGGILHSIVDDLLGGSSDFYSDVVSFATATLLVALPIFSWLFLRTKKMELRRPEVRRDTSRRLAIQLTLKVSFLVGIGRLIGYIFNLLNGTNSQPLADLVHAAITIGIAGGIFAYYWADSHRDDNEA